MFVKEVTSDLVVIDTPAKVNLFLQVLNRREDGYHNINSLFQAVSLFDRIRFRRLDEPHLRLELTNKSDLTSGNDNLISQAFESLKRDFNFTGGIEVQLEKNIPIAAGLGGGSSDAAATILATNILFGLGLEWDELAQWSLRIGSDVPFFFSSGQALVTGRGEIIEEIDIPKDYWLILVTPDLRLSTAAGYAALRRDLTKSVPAFRFLGCRDLKALTRTLHKAANDFESVQFETYSILDSIRKMLSEGGASLIRMSGSGPTVFGLFDNSPSLESTWLHDRGEMWHVCTVRPLSLPRQSVPTL
jgi:4-diphosphocytidyl-2-C-methyl-D-erythritol kinase